MTIMHLLSFTSQVRIAMVGKYTGLSDSYLSVLKVNFFFTQNYAIQLANSNHLFTLSVISVQ